MDAINLGADDGLPTVDWNAIVATLDDDVGPAPDAHNARSTWLTTINDDGSPHVTPVGALWLDGAYWFQTGAGTRKHHNVERDPPARWPSQSAAPTWWSRAMPGG